MQSNDIIPTVEEHMELKTTANQYQTENLQYECQDSPTVRPQDLENYHNHLRKSTSIYKQLSTQYTECPLAGYHQQQPSVGEDKPASS